MEFSHLSTEEYRGFIKQVFSSKFMDARLSNCVIPFLLDQDQKTGKLPFLEELIDRTHSIYHSVSSWDRHYYNKYFTEKTRSGETIKIYKHGKIRFITRPDNGDKFVINPYLSYNSVT